MKKTILSIFSLVLLVTGAQLILTSSSNGRASVANSGNTGAPGESTTCRSCHGSGFATTVSMAIKDGQGSVISSYIPGTVYDAEFTVNSSGATRYGFQMVGLTSSSTPVNGFANPSSNTRLVTLGNGRQYAEHAGKSSTNLFTTKWTAPSSGTGDITFYGSGAAVDNTGGTSGDGGHTVTLNLTENTSVGFVEATLRNELLVYPNPAKNQLRIKNTATETKDAIAELYTISGQLVLQEEMSLVENNPKKLNISKLKNGYYILKVSQNGDTMEEKIMIQN